MTYFSINRMNITKETRLLIRVSNTYKTAPKSTWAPHEIAFLTNRHGKCACRDISGMLKCDTCHKSQIDILVYHIEDLISNMFMCGDCVGASCELNARFSGSLIRYKDIDVFEYGDIVIITTTLKINVVHLLYFDTHEPAIQYHILDILPRELISTIVQLWFQAYIKQELNL